MIGINLANDFLPDIMKLELRDKELWLNLLVNTGIKDKNGKDVLEWKEFHKLYDGDNLEDFLIGFIKGIETIHNFDMIMSAQLKDEKMKVKDV